MWHILYESTPPPFYINLCTLGTILSPKKICGLFGGCPLFAGTTWKQQNLEGGFLKYISHYIGYVKLEFMKFTMGIDPLSSISMYSGVSNNHTMCVYLFPQKILPCAFIRPLLNSTMTALCVYCFWKNTWSCALIPYCAIIRYSTV